MTAVEPRPDAAATERRDDEPGLATLIGELSEEARQMVQLEAALAKAELGESVGHAKKAGAGFGAAAALGYVGFLFLSFAAAFGLAEIMPTGFAFLVVAAVWALIAAAAYLFGRRNLSAVDPVPHRTVESLKEDVTWLRRRSS